MDKVFESDVNIEKLKGQIKKAHPYHPEVSKQRILYAGRQVGNAERLYTLLGGDSFREAALKKVKENPTEPVVDKIVFHLMIYNPVKREPEQPRQPQVNEEEQKRGENVYLAPD